MNFKSQMMKDLQTTFLSLNEFADLCNIKWIRRGGKVQNITVKAVIDSYKSKGYEKNRYGFNANTFVLYSSLEEFGEKPKIKDVFVISGIRYVIEKITDDFGALKITMLKISE